MATKFKIKYSTAINDRMVYCPMDVSADSHLLKDRLRFWSAVLRMRRTPPTYSLDMVKAEYPGFDHTSEWGGYEVDYVDDACMTWSWEPGDPLSLMHPWYDYGRMPGRIGWAILARHWRSRCIAFYWHQLTAKNMAPGGKMAKRDRAAFEAEWV